MIEAILDEYRAWGADKLAEIWLDEQRETLVTMDDEDVLREYTEWCVEERKRKPLRPGTRVAMISAILHAIASQDPDDILRQYYEEWHERLLGWPDECIREHYERWVNPEIEAERRQHGP